MAFGGDGASEKEEEEEEEEEEVIKIPKGFAISASTLASMESLSLPLVQEVVLFADMQCQNCQKRVADIITKMNAETESVEVNVMEKKVTLTFRVPTIGEVMQRKMAPMSRTSLPKVAIMKRIFRSFHVLSLSQ